MHVVLECWEGRLGSELPTSTVPNSTDANAEAILGWAAEPGSGAGLHLGLEPGKQSPWLLSLKRGWVGAGDRLGHLGSGAVSRGPCPASVSDVAGWDDHGLRVAGRTQRRLGPTGLIPPI